MTTLAEVLATPSSDTLFEALLAAAQAKLLNSRGYTAYHLANVLLQLEAATESGERSIIFDLASGGFPDTATGKWLDLVALFYDETRGQPLTTIVTLRLSDTVGAGPYTLSNPIAVAYPGSAQPLYYRSQAGSVTVPRGGSGAITGTVDLSGIDFTDVHASGVAITFSTPAAVAVSTSQPSFAAWCADLTAQFAAHGVPIVASVSATNRIVFSYPGAITLALTGAFPAFAGFTGANSSAGSSSYVDAVFFAEAAGAVYNVAPGQIVDLATPVPGVGVTSPPIVGQGTILLTSGADAEADDPFRARLKDKWSLLGRGWMAATIRALIQQYDVSITRIVVLDPGPCPGVAAAYCAGTLAPITAAQALGAYLYLRSPDRKPVGNIPVGVYPALADVVTFAIALYVDSTNPNAQADAAGRLLAYQQSLAPGEPWRLSRVYAALDAPLDGAIGSHVTGVDPTLEVFAVGGTSVVEFVATWTVVGP